MKKTLMICSLLLAIAMLFSCSKDNEELIVGNWRIYSYENFSAGISADPQPPSPIEYVDNWGWVFNSDGTGYTYEIINGHESEMAQITYTINSDSLYIKSTNGPLVAWGIETLNRRNLRVSTMRTEVTDEEGNFLRYETGYLNFKKQ